MLQMFVLALSLYNTWNRGVFLLCKITNLLIYSIGIRKQETEFGTYNIYDIERSVCDLYRLEGETEIEVGIVKNIKENKYLYNRLLKYAEVLQIKRGL